MAVYRLSVDYTLGDQVAGPNGKVAFVPSFKLADATGTALGTAANPLISSSGNPATIVTGQLALTAATRGQLGSNALVNGVIIKSSPNNTANVLIGGSGVTSTADGSGNGYILAPGEAASFGVTNTNAIYAISTAAAVLSYEGN